MTLLASAAEDGLVRGRRDLWEGLAHALLRDGGRFCHDLLRLLVRLAAHEEARACEPADVRHHRAQLRANVAEGTLGVGQRTRERSAHVLYDAYRRRKY